MIFHFKFHNLNYSLFHRIWVILYTPLMDRASETDEADKTLAAEQEAVQKEKFQGRLADEYNDYIFLGKFSLDPRTSEVEEFIKNKLGDNAVSLESVLDKLTQQKEGKIQWVDMGGGRGLAMRQMALLPNLNGHVSMTNVDLVNFDLAGLDDSELSYLEQKYPGVLKDEVRPRFIKGNVETIQLPEPADLITSIELMQYLDHPIAAFCNWYNQLADGGFLIISAEHEWTGWIRYSGSSYTNDPHPIADIIELLKGNEIPFALSEDPYRPGHEPSKRPDRQFRNMIIQKIPDTSLLPASSVSEIWFNPHKYKAVYYQVNPPPIEIRRGTTTPSDLKDLYQKQLSKKRKK